MNRKQEMNHITMTDTHPVPSRPKNAFELVTVAALRAKQLLNGCVPKVEGSPKPARRALQEVYAGTIGALPIVIDKK
jgi:DNA-directed RNA polymerase subunit K/omega